MLTITESSCAEMMVNILINNIRNSILFIGVIKYDYNLGRESNSHPKNLNANGNPRLCIVLDNHMPPLLLRQLGFYVLYRNQL